VNRAVSSGKRQKKVKEEIKKLEKKF